MEALLDSPAQTIEEARAQVVEFFTYPPVEHQEALRAVQDSSDADIQDEFQTFVEKLPPGMQQNLNMIIDVKNLTPEQLRGLVAGGEATETMTNLAFAGRGDNEDPANWKGRATERGSEVSERNLGELTPPATPVYSERTKDAPVPKR